MHVRQSYSVSLCTVLEQKPYIHINNLGLCIRVHVFFYTLSIRLDMSHDTRKSVFRIKDQVRYKMGYTAIEAI